jgi:hypothetical protein
VKLWRPAILRFTEALTEVPEKVARQALANGYAVLQREKGMTLVSNRLDAYEDQKMVLETSPENALSPPSEAKAVTAKK